MSKFFKHLKMITKHRYQVFKLCCRCGLFWQGLVHDLSKFNMVEFAESVKFYSDNHSPINDCRKQKGYSNAWLHHKNRNKHHIEYWYDRENEIQMNMPYKYAVECVCDKIAASKCYNGKNFQPEMPLKHWLKWESQYQTNDNMKAFFTKVFTDYAELGEKKVLNKRYMKKTYSELVLCANEQINPINI